MKLYITVKFITSSSIYVINTVSLFQTQEYSLKLTVQYKHGKILIVSVIYFSFSKSYLCVCMFTCISIYLTIVARMSGNILNH